MSDPAHIIMKTSRSEYIKRIQTRAEINIKLGYNPEKYVLLHKELLVGLRGEKIIERTIIRSKKGEN